MKIKGAVARGRKWKWLAGWLIALNMPKSRKLTIGRRPGA
jgi:hypothetical protein